MFHGIGGKLDELFCAFELAIFLTERFVLPGRPAGVERASPERGQPLGDRRAKAAADPRADGVADDRHGLQGGILGGSFQDTAELLSERRSHPLAEHTGCFPDQIPEK
jgi:hypothetical protein